MTLPDLPTFDPGKFSADVLQKHEIGHSAELFPPQGIVKLGALLTVNQQCRLIFEEQVGMSVSEWFNLANQKFGLGE